MEAVRTADVRAAFALILAAPVFAAAPAGAFPAILNDWQDRYAAISPSGDNAGCQLCHGGEFGGSPWNAYGWDLLFALADSACDLNGDSAVDNDEAFYCVETLDSDGDSLGTDNVSEIGLGTQPGWRLGATNTLYTIASEIPNQEPPDDIGAIDPDGSTVPPPPPPPPSDDDGETGPLKFFQLVRPGQSIQSAIDRARPYGWIFVLPGEYRELADRTNGLNISKSGLHIIGLSTWRKRVVLKNAGNQMNGIAAVPPEHTECMSCHASMAPPFELLPGIEPLGEQDPVIHGLTITGITIDGFINNGLFTRRVDNFDFYGIVSKNNKNYGIFPTLSSNGKILFSMATGADDSGIWVETSENVDVKFNYVANNVNGFEVSNSDDITFAYNYSTGNTVGFANLLLPDIYDERPSAKRLTLRHNWIVANNKENTARPGSILSTVPKGIGILHVGYDDSLYEGNHVEGHDFLGLGIVDYCLVVLGTEFGCEIDPGPPGFLFDQSSTNNAVIGNEFADNGGNPEPGPFAAAAGDIGLLTAGDGGNCFQDNVFTTFFSTLGVLPPCE